MSWGIGRPKYQWYRITEHDTEERLGNYDTIGGILTGIRPPALHDCYLPWSTSHDSLRKGDKFVCKDCKDVWEYKEEVIIGKILTQPKMGIEDVEIVTMIDIKGKEMLQKQLKDWQRQNYYNEMVKLGELEELSDTTAPRLVILVRDDLLPQMAIGIQAMHSVITLADHLFSQGLSIDPRCYLILLGVESEEEMRRLQQKARVKVKKTSQAYSDPGLIDPETGEPPVTACSFEPMTADELKRVFGGLRRAS